MGFIKIKSINGDINTCMKYNGLKTQNIQRDEMVAHKRAPLQSLGSVRQNRVHMKDKGVLRRNYAVIKMETRRRQ